MPDNAICILCLELINKEEDNRYFCPNCEFSWEYKLDSNSPFLNQFLKLIEMYKSNNITQDIIELAIDNWINELDLSIQDSNLKINIPIPKVLQKAINYSLSSLKKLKNSLEKIDINNIDSYDFKDVKKEDELTLKVYNEIKKLLDKINTDKYYLLEQYRKEKIDIENIKIEEIDYE